MWWEKSTPSGLVEFTQPKKVSGPRSYAETLVSVIIEFPSLALRLGREREFFFFLRCESEVCFR